MPSCWRATALADPRRQRRLRSRRGGDGIESDLQLRGGLRRSAGRPGLRDSAPEPRRRSYDAGRIINPKTARSQAIGGIIWGVGQALLEQSETDPATGRFVNRNYSGYLVPTNADIPELDVLFVGEFDEEASPLGAKGLGELTAVSVAPAIANAVYHATGKRIRDLPITIEKLL